jgi:hypothetical protein
MDERALQLEVEGSRAARLRAWAVLGELRAILTGAGQELPKAAEKSFVKEGEILEQGLRRALAERDEALKELAAAARWVDRAAFKGRRRISDKRTRLCSRLWIRRRGLFRVAADHGRRLFVG